MKLREFALAGLYAGLIASPQEKAPREKMTENPPVLKEFERRVSDYVKLHKTARSEVHPVKATNSPGEIKEYEHRLATRIRVSWPPDRHGTIFDAEISVEFRRLIAATMKSPKGNRIRESLLRAAPAGLPVVRVGDTYPDNLPLQSMPPSLLLNLPKLPPEVEYRLVGNDLVLRDIEANLIVDFVTKAIP